MEQELGEVGGWKAPCTSFDYRKMEREAQRECEVLHRRMTKLKGTREKDPDKELLRRRELCMLTDIYYEQRHRVKLFQRRAEEREACHFSPAMVE